MDKNILGHLMLAFIDSSYPGGAEKFTEDGGIICVVPFLQDAVLFYLPQESPPEFQDAINQMNERSSISIDIIDTVNFEGRTPNEIIPCLLNAIKEIAVKYQIENILINPTNPIMLSITIPLKKDLEKYIIEDIINIFNAEVPGIYRGLITVGGTHYTFSCEGLIEELQESEIKTTTPEPDIIESSESSILDENIDQLKEILNQEMDVLDFLQQLEGK
jgi:hypothetical protein